LRLAVDLCGALALSLIGISYWHAGEFALRTIAVCWGVAGMVLWARALAQRRPADMNLVARMRDE
jgi:hypothetical protein